MIECSSKLWKKYHTQLNYMKKLVLGREDTQMGSILRGRYLDRSRNQLNPFFCAAQENYEYIFHLKATDTSLSSLIFPFKSFSSSCTLARSTEHNSTS